MTLKVWMIPELASFRKEESGIRRVIEAYSRYLPEFDVEIVTKGSSYDVVASHAGAAIDADVVHSHGIYWTADYASPRWEWAVNADVVNAVRQAKQITVPSRWVQKVFQRDMRLSPTVVPHGIEWQDWVHNQECSYYVLWNKNRNLDVCDPSPIRDLALAHPDVKFISTYLPSGSPSNVRAIGLQPHNRMKEVVQRAGVYLSTTKETFGIGVLEALASGVPVLGYAYGGNLDIIQHGVNGYLAKPGDAKDLAEGLSYCMKYRSVLGENAKITVRDFTWQKACEIVAGVYRLAVQEELPTVSIIIPTYNYADKVGRAIKSAMEQDYDLLQHIIVVDDGSTDAGATRAVVTQYASDDKRVLYIRQDNAGVANARNAGIAACDSKYVCCLDADDAIDPRFIRACVEALESDRSLGIAYTGLYYIKASGEEGVSEWPDKADFDAQLQKRNQIPTCCVFRRNMWERLGGYKQRYAPGGAGAEDAEFWLRAGAYGYGAKKVTDAGLFIYSWETGRVSGSRDYKEVDWTELHPWTKDGKHPFASMATPKNKFSHPVRQYDQPTVSVVIPVAKNHYTADALGNALDGLESQTFRNWEVIAVVDTDEQIKQNDFLQTAYPYVEWIFLDKVHGAGYARNRGAEVAKAPLLLFLDADDWLMPTAIEDMLRAWNENKAIVYTDYIGKAYMSEEEAKKLKGRLLHYNSKKGEAVIAYKAFDFECEKAQKQPTKDIYIWCLVSSLVPKSWHDQIGGFDESMESWEDWDYWIRHARSGRCFYHLEKQLVLYRFYTGGRRDAGISAHQNLVKYLLDKYSQGVDNVSPCNCGSRRARSSTPVYAETRVSTPVANKGAESMSDDDYVLIEYLSPNRGQHKVVGPVTKKVYGHRAGGDKFYAHKLDVQAHQHFHEIPRMSELVVEEEPKEKKAVEAPKQVAKVDTVEPKKEIEEQPIQQPEPLSRQYLEFNVELIPGVTSVVAEHLKDMDIDSYDAIVALGVEGLQKIKQVGAARARAIYDFAVMQIEARLEQDEV